MGLRDDLDRFRDIGEERRQDLSEFIKHGNLGDGETINVPIKIVDLPEFVYNPWDQGGVGQGGDADVGDPVDAQPQPGDEDGDGDDGEAGEGEGEHGYYEMDPEEFAEELDEELGLDLEPKGKKVTEEIEGDFTDIATTGPDSTLDFERMFKEGLKRNLALNFDEDYLREVLRVDGMGPATTYTWARNHNIPVSKAWLEEEYKLVPRTERAKYDSIEELEGSPKAAREHFNTEDIVFREADKQYRYPETVEKKERNVVIVNIRDVSGSMREKKRELVERVFTPLDWYLQGKYDNAEFVYIAHDSEAWRVERDEFFGIRSGGGTRISSAYDLAQEILESQYPWSEWNRYVFCAGDGENASNDSKENVIPLMKEIDTNLHAYVETRGNSNRAKHGEEVEREFGTDHDNVTVTYVDENDEVTDAIYDILSTEGDTDD